MKTAPKDKMSFRRFAWHRNADTGKLMSGKATARAMLVIHALAIGMGTIATLQGLWYVGLFFTGVIGLYWYGTYKNWQGKWV